MARFSSVSIFQISNDTARIVVLKEVRSLVSRRLCVLFFPSPCKGEDEGEGPNTVSASRTNQDSALSGKVHPHLSPHLSISNNTARI
jgi:hypothetical protein